MHTTNKHWIQVQNYIEGEAWNDALPLLKILRSLYPEEAEIAHLYIKAQFVMGEGEITSLKEVCRIFPHYLPLHRDLLALLLHTENVEEAREKALQNFQDFGESSELWTDYGVIFRYMNRYIQAESCYQRAISLNSDCEFAWFNWANMLFEGGDVAKAEQLYLRVIRIQPKNIEAWVQLIICVYTTKEYLVALRYVQEAKRRGGELAIFFYWESRIQLQREKVEEAKNAIHLALENGNRKIFWEQLICLLKREGKDISEAEYLLNKAE